MNTSIIFSDCVRHLYIPSINIIFKSSDYGMRFWLANGSNYVITSSSKDYFEITFYDLIDVLSYLASDINRLSCASLESVSNIKESENNKKFLAWNLINYYYSAFFSAHCILKLLGFGLIQINKDIIDNLQKKANAFSQTLAPISSGMYCFSIDVSNSKVIFYKLDRYNDSHQGLWRRFAEFLNVLIGVSIVTGKYDTNCIKLRQPNAAYPLSVYSHLSSVDANEVVDRIDDLKKVLNTKGDFNWLSWVRNMVNYSHEFGVWFPYKNYQKQYEKILTLKSLCYENPMSLSFNMSQLGDLVKFVTACQLINAMSFNINDDLLSRHPENKSFLLNGFAAYKKFICPVPKVPFHNTAVFNKT